MTSQLTARASVSLMHVSCFQTARQEGKEDGVDSSMPARSPLKNLVTASILAAVNRFSRFFNKKN